MMSENTQKYRFLTKLIPGRQKRRIVLLTGARQTGKTTLAKKAYADLRYINLDAPENREFLNAVSSDAWHKDIGDAVIDEAQKEPLVFEKIKYAYDAGNIAFQVLLGSSQILLLKKIRESLAGRVSIYELWPLMMSELYTNLEDADVKSPVIEHLFSDKNLDNVFENLPGVLLGSDNSIRRRAESYLLKWGGMPALLPLSDEDRWKWLKDYEYTYLERDLADLSRLDDLGPFRKFQKLAALRSGNLLNYSELARDTSISVDTARRYLEYLAVSYQVILVQPYFRNITSSTVKTPKIYWLDIGLMRQLCGFKGDDFGNIYETMIVGELVKWIKTMQKDAEVYFYRTRSGLELDILLKTNSGIIGMEIKGRKNITAADTRPMRDIAKKLGKEWRGGMVIYKGDIIGKICEPSIWAVPSYRLFTA
ncbi:MAG: ATP-binding protein [Candidatus Omnitrophica bacterium]|nr:ATP-binding protein [Candidatus Omnitrophota bacterium]